MTFITEQYLAEKFSDKANNNQTEFELRDGQQLTALAEEFLQRRGIAVVGEHSSQKKNSKPEHMTNLYGNTLVQKCHPIIILRGKLDSLSAEILSLQLTAKNSNELQTVKQLQQLLYLAKQIMAAEVKKALLPPIELLNMNAEQLRYTSHHVQKEIGIPHPIVSHDMGAIVVGLNKLRTMARECELCAVAAFDDGSGGTTRTDIITALNRMSSAVYIMLCRYIAHNNIEFKAIAFKD